MGREGENLTTGAGEPPSAADAYKASGAALGGLHGWSDCRSGTKGQPPLAFPRAGGPPGEGCGADEQRRASARQRVSASARS
ncbi:Ribbon-helix-helix protein, copG family (fragment) [Sphingomonas aurantiaca]|uniref:Ribbon-helix-helix protein, copG family n=1 Tax=Sphingomonas aurantiaca TaxID=185949 RepID=A0A5E8APK3_9SPHN